jgi:hypothetical protein
LNPEWWGSPLVQEKYREEQAMTRDNKNNNTITIIIIIIGIAIPDYSNVNANETENLRKYKDLAIEVNSMWKVRSKIVPAIIGALGTIKKGLDQNLLLLPGHPSAREMQWAY